MSEAGVAARRVLMDAAGMGEAIATMARRVRDMAQDGQALAFVGIRRRGVPLAERLRAATPDFQGAPLGKLDITLYRDDLSSLGPQPVVGPTELPFDVDGHTIVLVDDVLFTGRTVRAALDALVAFGRPRAVILAVLVDRGHREYPIQPDVCGATLETRREQNIEVKLAETDGEDQVELISP